MAASNKVRFGTRLLNSDLVIHPDSGPEAMFELAESATDCEKIAAYSPIR